MENLKLWKNVIIYTIYIIIFGLQFKIMRMIMEIMSAVKIRKLKIFGTL